MIEELEGCEPLSQVWFVHDYIQLIFQDKTVTLNNPPVLETLEGRKIHRRSDGFCDALVALINQPLVDATVDDGVEFQLSFGNGGKLTVPLCGPDALGPEGAETGCRVFFNNV